MKEKTINTKKYFLEQVYKFSVNKQMIAVNND